MIETRIKYNSHPDDLTINKVVWKRFCFSPEDIRCFWEEDSKSCGILLGDFEWVIEMSYSEIFKLTKIE